MVRFALLGCGRIAKRYGELLGKGVIPGARLVAICDIDAKARETFHRDYGAPAFDSLDSMMAKMGSEIDVVAVLTPSGYHAEHCIRVASYRKHVVVEKPMALTLTDADEMIRACDAAGVRLFVVKQNRYNPPIVALKNAIQAGDLGKLVMGTIRVRWCRDQSYYDSASWRGTWALDGGVLANQASHHLDLLMWMMGDVESVCAMGSTALVNIETEDTAVGIVRFTSGALGVIEATTATRPKDLEGSISVLGENGSVEIGGFAVNEVKTWNITGASSKSIDSLKEVPPNVYGFGHQKLLNDVVASVERDEGRALVEGLEGRKSLELIIALYESMETGKPVHLRFRQKRARLGFIEKRN